MLYLHYHSNKNILKFLLSDFPGGPVVKTLPSNAGGVGSIPGWGACSFLATCLMAKNPKNIKQKQYCNKFNKDFENGPHQTNLNKISVVISLLTHRLFQNQLKINNLNTK